MKRNPINSFWADFQLFLKQSKFFDVALGLIIATSVRDLVNSFATNIISPLIDQIFLTIGIETGQNNTKIFGAALKVSAFLADFIAFLFIIFITYLILKTYIFIEKENPYEREDQQQATLDAILEQLKENNNKN